MELLILIILHIVCEYILLPTSWRQNRIKILKYALFGGFTYLIVQFTNGLLQSNNILNSFMYIIITGLCYFSLIYIIPHISLNLKLNSYNQSKLENALEILFILTLIYNYETWIMN